MELIVITAPTEIPDEALMIERLFTSGLTCLHIRKPKWSSKQIEALLHSIDPQYFNKIVLHGHYHLAIKYKLKGIHLHRRHRSSKWRNRVKRFFIKLKHPKLLMTTTFNSLESLRDNRQAFDYVFLSSVFNSHAYYHKDEEAGVNMLRSIVSKSICPVYALGGVTQDKLPTVVAAGFKGAGFSSAIWAIATKNPDAISGILNQART